MVKEENAGKKHKWVKGIRGDGVCIVCGKEVASVLSRVVQRKQLSIPRAKSVVEMD